MIDDVELRVFGDGLRRAAGSCSGPALDAALAELGWPEALQAFPGTAVRLLFEAQGSAGATSGALSLVLASGLGLDPGAGTVVLPLPDETAQPGQLRGEQLVLRGLTTAPAIQAGQLLVVCLDDSGKEVALTVPVGAGTTRAVHGVDPLLELVEVAVAAPAVATEPVPGSWDEAVRLGRLALGHELVGAGRAMLDLARTHALDREQFGRPISGFQAVRHRLADTLVALEAAGALLDAAWDDGGEDTAAMAKALAGRSARTASRHCQQVLAGIGFTTEHRFHLYARRVLVLDQLLGSARTLTRALGEQVLAQRGLPPPIPL